MVGQLIGRLVSWSVGRLVSWSVGCPLVSGRLVSWLAGRLVVGWLVGGQLPPCRGCVRGQIDSSSDVSPRGGLHLDAGNRGSGFAPGARFRGRAISLSRAFRNPFRSLASFCASCGDTRRGTQLSPSLAPCRAGDAPSRCKWVSIVFTTGFWGYHTG